jgi:hypothetical protein
MSANPEFDTFNAAMDTILRADPKAVKAEMDAGIQASRVEREARGERRRGRKAKKVSSSSAPASRDEA